MQTNTTAAKDSAAALRMRLFGIHSSSGASGNTNRDVAALQAIIHTQTAQALVESTSPSQATARPPLRVEAYASALSQGARALSASGHAAAMAAVVSKGDNVVVVKIPKKKLS